MTSHSPNTAAQIRAALIAECDRAYASAYRSARGVRQGILTGQAVIAAADDDPDPRRFVDRLWHALECERRRLCDPDDEDGFVLGGLATVRRAVERERERLGPPPH